MSPFSVFFFFFGVGRERRGKMEGSAFLYSGNEYIFYYFQILMTLASKKKNKNKKECKQKYLFFHSLYYFVFYFLFLSILTFTRILITNFLVFCRKFPFQYFFFHTCHIYDSELCATLGALMRNAGFSIRPLIFPFPLFVARGPIGTSQTPDPHLPSALFLAPYAKPLAH